MIRGNPVLSSGLIGVGLLGFVLGCGAERTQSALTAVPGEDAVTGELAACGLDDGTIEHGAHLHACDPSDHKKTTICHIPPGNPANAHTICVGNAAVPAHLHNHGDYLGACVHETPCPPPASGAAGAGGDTGSAGASPGAAGAGGAGSGAAGAAGSSAAGAGGSYIIP
jgi:hypothetical protein